MMRKLAVALGMSIFWSIGYIDLMNNTVAGVIIGIIIGCAFAELDSDMRNEQ